MVSVPTTEHCKYDLVIDRGGALLRVQVKTCVFINVSGAYEVQLRTNGANYTTKNNTTKISKEMCDVVFIVTGDGVAYEIPSEKLHERNTVSMTRGWLKFKVGDYPAIVRV